VPSHVVAWLAEPHCGDQVGELVGTRRVVGRHHSQGRFPAPEGLWASLADLAIPIRTVALVPMVAFTHVPGGVGLDADPCGLLGRAALAKSCDWGGVDAGVALPAAADVPRDHAHGRLHEPVGHPVDADLLAGCVLGVTGSDDVGPLGLGEKAVARAGEWVDDGEQGVDGSPGPGVGVGARGAVGGDAETGLGRIGETVGQRLGHAGDEQGRVLQCQKKQHHQHRPVREAPRPPTRPLPGTLSVLGPPPVYLRADVGRVDDGDGGLGERSLRDAVRLTGVDHTTIGDVLAGRAWADIATLARLEVGLGADLWPSRAAKGKH